MNVNKKNIFSLAVEVKLHCLCVICINNIQTTCNLKGVGIDESGNCAGKVLFQSDEKKDSK